MRVANLQTHEHATAAMDQTADLIFNFLRDIGIDVQEQSFAEPSFLPGVRIVDGGLRVDRNALRWPGDLLHEAGHLAVVPTSMRHTLSDALDTQQEVEHGGEVEATAWAYAAIVHLGLDPALLFHAGGYHGQSDALILTFALGVYPGSFGLSQAGMTLTGPEAARANMPPYPHMTHWLRR